MSKNIVFFFENSQLYVTNASFPDHGIRGYCPDGCWSLDYNMQTETVSVCIGSMGEILWDKPINTYRAKLVSQIDIPDDIAQTGYLTIVKWAKNERDKKVA
jgi:hypothetical protein